MKKKYMVDKIENSNGYLRVNAYPISDNDSTSWWPAIPVAFQVHDNMRNRKSYVVGRIITADFVLTNSFV